MKLKNKKLIVVEFFCGMKSISKEFERRGHKVFTIDFDKKFNPDLCIDVLNFKIKDLPKEFRKPDVVWASPPCQTFSVASLYRYWINGKPKTSKTFIGLAIAKKTIEIIEELNPKYYFIENPRAMLRKQDFMRNLHRQTLTYCQYGSNVQKPTDIWTNHFGWVPKRKCAPGSPCHESARRGEDRGTQSQSRSAISRAIIPLGLCREIADICEGKLKIRQSELTQSWALGN